MGYSGKNKHSRAGKAYLERGGHSPAGKQFLELGDENYEQIAKSKQQTARLKKEVAAMDSKVPKPITISSRPSTSGSSTPLSSKEWHAKYKGGNVTQSSLRAYRGYLRGFRGK